jgi:hypothetical protein
MNIRETIEAQRDLHAHFGWPALLERFVLHRGREGKAAKLRRGVKRGTKKACFSNATNLVLQTPGLVYVEGYAITPLLPGYLVHHAWAEDAEGNVIDNTLDKPAKCEYFGVPFDAMTLYKELSKVDFYCLLCPGELYNIDLIFKMVPELEAEIKAIPPNEKLTKIKEQINEVSSQLA